MSFSVMLQQLAGGMLVSIEIFFVTLLFSLGPYLIKPFHTHQNYNLADENY